MSAGKKKKQAREVKKKPPPRWRKYLVQAELELPPPQATLGFEDRRNGADRREDDVPVAPLAWWQSRAVVGGLVACCALLLVGTVVALVRASNDREYANAARASVRELTVRASTTERDLHIAPNPRSWSATPDAALAVPDPPEMLNLYFPIGYTNYLTFAVTVDKVDHGRVLTVQRMAPDSNRDLRLSLNSSAFGPGEYRFRVQGYTWRGDRVDAGWVRLLISARAP